MASYVHLAAIHPHHYKQQTFRRPKPMLSSQSYVHAANLTISSLTRASCSFPNPLLITCQKHKLQFLSPKTIQNPNFFISKNRVSSATATALCETNTTTTSKDTPKIPATEICILVSVYILPFLNRLNMPSKFPVLKYAMSPIMPLLEFYQSIPTLGLIAFLALFIVFVRYRNYTKFKHSLVMDCVVVIASLVRPFLVNQDPLAVGALGFKLQLLNVLELLGFQTCIHSCSEYLGAVQCVREDEKVNEEEKINEEEERKVSVATDVSDPFIDKLACIVEVVLKTNGSEGRRQGKSLVLKLIREHDSLLSDVNSAVALTCNKNILSSCQSCLHSLLNIFKEAVQLRFSYYKDLDEKISLEADNLLWLLNILEDRQAAEEFALMWANQQELASLHAQISNYRRHLVSCITTRLLVGIRNGDLLPSKGTRHLLLLTWFQPLVYDYSCLRKLNVFDPKLVEENIEKTILELTLEDQQSILLGWFECFLKKGDNCPDLRQAFEGWCKRSFGKTPPDLPLPL